MTGTLTHIWRHPIKSHGHEALERIAVTAGTTLPWDRTWAVAHDHARLEEGWSPCQNFSRGAKAPALMAIDASLDEETETVTLRHPERETLRFHPDAPGDLPGFLEWVAPLMPPDRAASARIVRIEGRGMTDSDFPSISLGNLASLRALSDKVGQPLDPRRFRINLWIDGFAPWEEFGWVGQDISIGETRFRVEEPIERCLATTANPETGRRDADTLGALEAGWGHREFGVYLTALSDGMLETGQPLDTPA